MNATQLGQPCVEVAEASAVHLMVAVEGKAAQAAAGPLHTVQGVRRGLTKTVRRHLLGGTHKIDVANVHGIVWGRIHRHARRHHRALLRAGAPCENQKKVKGAANGSKNKHLPLHGDSGIVYHK